MGQRLFAPHDRIARVVAQAVEQLGEVQVEVGQKRVHADDIGQRRAQVAPVFLHPVLERGALEVDQARAEGLVRLQVFMRHRADRDQVELVGQVDVRRALEVDRQLARQRLHHFVVPLARKAAAHAEVEELERVGARGFFAEGAQLVDLLAQARTRHVHGLGLVEAAEIQLVDDIQHEDFIAHHVHQRAAGADAQVRAVGRDLDELALEAKQREEVSEVALDEAQSAQVGDFVLGKHHRAQVIELAFDVFLELRQRISRLVTAAEFVLARRARVAVQQSLPHREFIQIGFKQAANYWFHRCSRSMMGRAGLTRPARAWFICRRLACGCGASAQASCPCSRAYRSGRRTVS